MGWLQTGGDDASDADGREAARSNPRGARPVSKMLTGCWPMSTEHLRPARRDAGRDLGHRFGTFDGRQERRDRPSEGSALRVLVDERWGRRIASWRRWFGVRSLGS